MTRVEETVHRLEREYGPRQWQRDDDAMGVLIQTILSQNTSDTNSHRAYASLRAAFPNWELLALADADDIAEVIKSGGLAMIKAKRIKTTLQQIREQRGDFDLSFLGQLPLPEAKSWLAGLSGVGPKTAACVLLFGLGKPALPVDTHVHRISKRLGLIDAKVSANSAHEVLEALLPPQYVYQWHLHLLEHGRRVCHAQRPRCDRCVLADLCPSASQGGKKG
jgi:endonuclease-3